jgi:hypothetical protein
LLPDAPRHNQRLQQTIPLANKFASGLAPDPRRLYYKENLMGVKLPKRQKWLEHALQGLAFWIGHRHSFFNSYHLTEGALVAEACNLIQANLPKHQLTLLPECMYKNLVAHGTKIDYAEKSLF